MMKMSFYHFRDKWIWSWNWSLHGVLDINVHKCRIHVLDSRWSGGLSLKIWQGWKTSMVNVFSETCSKFYHVASFITPMSSNFTIYMMCSDRRSVTLRPPYNETPYTCNMGKFLFIFIFESTVGIFIHCSLYHWRGENNVIGL